MFREEAEEEGHFRQFTSDLEDGSGKTKNLDNILKCRIFYTVLDMNWLHILFICIWKFKFTQQKIAKVGHDPDKIKRKKGFRNVWEKGSEMFGKRVQKCLGKGFKNVWEKGAENWCECYFGHWPFKLSRMTGGF